MQVVGGFYLLLFVLTSPWVSLPPKLISGMFAVDTASVEWGIVVDTWFMFGLELAALGIMLLWASRDPLRHEVLAWTIMLVELLRGIVDDVYLLTRGYDPSFAGTWIVVHAVVIGTGWWAIRRAHAEAASPPGRPA